MVPARWRCISRLEGLRGSTLNCRVVRRVWLEVWNQQSRSTRMIHQECGSATVGMNLRFGVEWETSERGGCNNRIRGSGSGRIAHQRRIHWAQPTLSKNPTLDRKPRPSSQIRRFKPHRQSKLCGIAMNVYWTNAHLVITRLAKRKKKRREKSGPTKGIGIHH